MIKHLKLFQESSQYESFINGDGVVLPNVSYIEGEELVWFNPYYEEPSNPNLVCTYNVTSTASTTTLCYRVDNLSKMVIDGVEMEPSTTYKFNSTGEHSVEYVLTDPTLIKNFGFYNCTALTSIRIPASVTNVDTGSLNNCTGLESIVVDSKNTKYHSGNDDNCIVERDTNMLINGCKNTIIPDGVVRIKQGAFQFVTGLKSITIPATVTIIDPSAFYGCSDLAEIISLATVAPSLEYNSFRNVKSNGVLKYPSGSDYSSWLSTETYYLGNSNWTSETF